MTASRPDPPVADVAHLVTVDVPVPHPFDAPGVFAWLAARALPGVEHATTLDDGTLRYARTLTAGGRPAALEVTARPRGTGWSVSLQVETQRPDDVAEVVAAARRLLGLDVDPLAVDAALAADPVLAPLVAATPGVRVPGAVDAAEYAVRAIAGQQISVAAARAHLTRFAALLGEPYASSFEGLTTLFPTSRTIAERVPVTQPGSAGASDPERPLRLPARVVAAVVGASQALNDGTLTLGGSGSCDVAQDDGGGAQDDGGGAQDDKRAVRARLAELPGVGPWTAEYLAMRVLRDPDAWPVGDVALLAGAAAIGIAPAPDLPPGRRHRELAARAEAWAPWRSYAALHLWRASAPPRPRKEEP